MADIPPNKTIYCQNLYEKIRSTDRELLLILSAISSQIEQSELQCGDSNVADVDKSHYLTACNVPCRDEEVLVCCVLAIWEDPRHSDHAQCPIERTGLGSI